MKNRISLSHSPFILSFLCVLVDTREEEEEAEEAEEVGKEEEELNQ